MLPNKHFAKYKIAEWFFAEKSCGMHYTRLIPVASRIDGHILIFHRKKLIFWTRLIKIHLTFPVKVLHVTFVDYFSNKDLANSLTKSQRIIESIWDQPENLKWTDFDVLTDRRQFTVELNHDASHNYIAKHVFNYKNIIIQQFWVKLNMTRPIPCIGQFGQSNAGIAVKISDQFNVLKLEK